MKSRYYTWIVLSLLIISGAVVLFSDPWSTTGNDFENILSENLQGADRILLMSAFDSLEFNFSGSQWRFGDEELNKQAVENLLLAASRLTMRSIMPIADLKDISEVLELHFFKGKRKLGAYIFAKDGQTYYIFTAGSSEAYGIELAGYENMPLEKIFSGRADHYRKHLLIDLLPSEIHTIEIHPLQGLPFRAVQDTSYNIIVTDLSGEKDYTATVEEQKIRMLFSYFNGIRYSKLATQQSIVSGSIQEHPSATVIVSDFDNRKYKFYIYQWVKVDGDQPDMYDALVRFNDNPGMLIVNYSYLDLLMRGLGKYIVKRDI